MPRFSFSQPTLPYCVLHLHVSLIPRFLFSKPTFPHCVLHLHVSLIPRFVVLLAYPPTLCLASPRVPYPQVCCSPSLLSHTVSCISTCPLSPGFRSPSLLSHTVSCISTCPLSPGLLYSKPTLTHCVLHLHVSLTPRFVVLLAYPSLTVSCIYTCPRAPGLLISKPTLSHCILHLQLHMPLRPRCVVLTGYPLLLCLTSLRTPQPPVCCCPSLPSHTVSCIYTFPPASGLLISRPTLPNCVLHLHITPSPSPRSVDLQAYPLTLCLASTRAPRSQVC
ncbi:hypothetical protein PoB_003518300 [Plakobranchus ocellatus]|uniref:Uncharacterized protein n=1 Tax=Plakobranchus ocellatus TaxID=259542 RepID=A0AAV4AN01_9GAST|nr:hypothetical protein PoB_003518300 [Plakobranchus ocellatus]